MKFTTLVVTQIMALVSFNVLAAPFELDAAHTEVGFSVRHLMISDTKGVFRDFKGSLDFDEAQGIVKNVEVEIPVASVDTRDAKRDEHLKSPDFFDAATYPLIVFKAGSISVKEGKPIKAKGTLTIRGVSKPVVLDLTYAGKKMDPFGTTHWGFNLSTKVNRKDYGVSWNKTLDQGGVAVGDLVTIDISGELIPRREKK